MIKKIAPLPLISFLFLLLMNISLLGCVSRGGAIPNAEPSMADIYEEVMGESHLSSLDQIRRQASPLSHSKPSAFAEEEKAKKEIERRFPLLPNPTLALYIYPHVVGEEQLPIPGYITVFPLYDKQYYALPGEIGNQ